MSRSKSVKHPEILLCVTCMHTCNLSLADIMFRTGRSPTIVSSARRKYGPAWVGKRPTGGARIEGTVAGAATSAGQINRIEHRHADLTKTDPFVRICAEVDRAFALMPRRIVWRVAESQEDREIRTAINWNRARLRKPKT